MTGNKTQSDADKTYEDAIATSNHIPFTESTLRILYFIMMAVEASVLGVGLLGMYWFGHGNKPTPTIEFWYSASIFALFIPVTLRGYILSAWNLKRVLAGQGKVIHSAVPAYDILYGWFNHVAVLIAGIVIPIVLALTLVLHDNTNMEWLYYVFLLLPLFSMAQFMIHSFNVITWILPAHSTVNTNNDEEEHA